MINIIIEDDIYVTSNRNVINTIFYIEYNNVFFPNAKWTDFTFPILEEWKNNLLKINNSNNITINLYFHDGPFWLEVEKNENGELKIECISDRLVRESKLTINCAYNEFLKCLYKAMRTFLKVLYNNKMDQGNFASIYKQTVLSIKEIKEIIK